MPVKNNEFSTLALFLQKRCQTLNITPRKLHAQSGVSIRSIYNLLSGKTNFIIDSNLQPLSTHLQCSIKEIYAHTNKKYLPKAITPLGNLLFSLRVDANLSVTMLAEVLGITPNTVTANEQQKHRLLRPTTALMLSAVFQVEKRLFVPFLADVGKLPESLFGKKLRFYRRRELFSLSRLAKLLHTSKQVLSQYEQGRCFPTEKTLRAIALLLNTSYGELRETIQKDLSK